MKKEIYVVTMYRLGRRDGHSYVLGAFTKKQKAITATEIEIKNRGEKYMPEIIECIENEVDNDYIFKIIMPLKDPSYI